ncbi:MAG TPA: DinB family protein [Pyrinomonadaceae bacterium]
MRARLRAELEAGREEFHSMADAISEPGWNESSNNPGWTNGQVLFHILLGFILVLPLSWLLIFFGHLPRVCGKAFAAILNFSTPLFHWINKIGPRAAARVLGRNGVIRMFGQVHRAILIRLERVRSSQWALSMHFPTRWDPRFRADMRLEDLFFYPVAHLRHHSAQLRAR